MLLSWTTKFGFGYVELQVLVVGVCGGGAKVRGVFRGRIESSTVK